MRSEFAGWLRGDLQVVAGRENFYHIFMRDRHCRTDRNFREFDCLCGVFVDPLAGQGETEKSAEPFYFLAGRALASGESPCPRNWRYGPVAGLLTSDRIDMIVESTNFLSPVRSAVSRAA